MRPLRWTLLAASVVGAAVAAVTAATPEVVRRVVDLGASSLSNLARSARALLPL